MPKPSTPRLRIAPAETGANHDLGHDKINQHVYEMTGQASTKVLLTHAQTDNEGQHSGSLTDWFQRFARGPSPRSPRSGGVRARRARRDLKHPKTHGALPRSGFPQKIEKLLCCYNAGCVFPFHSLSKSQCF